MLNNSSNQNSPAIEMQPFQRQISVNRGFNRQESVDRQKMRRIFNKYDRNADGFLDHQELRNLIRERPDQSEEVPVEFCETVGTFDTNRDNRLDFEEFYRMCKEHRWLIKGWCIKYCNLLVPPRKAPPNQFRPMAARFSATDTDLTDRTDSFGESYGDKIKFCPPPLTMVLFSIVEVCFFIVDIVHLRDYESDMDRIGTSVDGPAAQLFIYNPWKRYEAWRFVTYMFVHVGVMHIVMNLIVQIFLGIALEIVHCWWRVSLVYLSGVIAGSMGTSLVNPTTYLAGASGGVYALLTAHVATIIMNFKEMGAVNATAQLFVFLVFIITDIGTSIDRHFNDPTDSVGYIAHLSGGIAGLLVGIGVLRNLEVRRFERYLWWIAVTIYTLLMLTGISIHIFYPDWFPKNRVYISPSKSGIF